MGVSVSILVVAILVGVFILAVYLVKRHRKSSTQPSPAAAQQAISQQPGHYNQPQINPPPPVYVTEQLPLENQQYPQPPAVGIPPYGHPLPYNTSQPPAMNTPFYSQAPGMPYDSQQLSHDPPEKPHTTVTAEDAPPSAPFFYHMDATPPYIVT